MGTVQSVERALSLLEEAARQPGGLVELAARADLPVSTAARLLGTLEGAEALSRAGDGTYRIGPLVRGMGHGTNPGIDLITAAEPHLSELAAGLNEAVCVATLVGRDTVTVRQVDAPKPVRAEDWTGTSVPLHAGSAGTAVMATWADEDVEEFLAGDLEACTEATITDPDKLRERIRRTRAERVIWTDSEYVTGLASCAAAILDTRGRAIGSLYAYGPNYRFPTPRLADAIAAVILKRADAISAELGYRPGSGTSR